jgi:hypothetical protein
LVVIGSPQAGDAGFEVFPEERRHDFAPDRLRGRHPWTVGNATRDDITQNPTISEEFLG